MSKPANMPSAIEPWNLVAAGHTETTRQMMFGAIPAIPEPRKSIGALENPDVFRQEMPDARFGNVQI